ncbi:PQQ-binding-like beta-propeller repeat protein [Nocardia lasii]|uniref:PQQ-binding-like beta-propeller repeat protein n=1 Tax=Nocardia lasii TaxID=1616107 RepID=A0ABW1JNV6_9NOCA
MAFSATPHGPGRPNRARGIARQLLDPAVPVIPIRPLTLLDIVVGSARAVVRHWKVSVGFTLAALVAGVAAIMFVTYVLVALAMSAMGSSDDSLTALMVGFGGTVLVVIGAIVAIGIPCDAAINGVVTIAADRAIRGAPVVFAEVFARMRERFWPLCRLMCAFSLLLVVPGWVIPVLALFAGGLPAMLVSMPVVLAGEFAFGILFSLAPIVLMLEDKGVAASLKRSAALAKPSFWRLLGLHSAWLVMVLVVLLLTYCPLGLVLSVIGQATFAMPLYMLAYFAVAMPLFRTAQTLIYTDLLIREGSYGHDLIRELTANAGAPPSNTRVDNSEPIFVLEPFHVARVAGVIAVVLAIVDLPDIAWFIIAAGCAFGEWHTRTKSIPWPPQIREFLVSMRLAEPISASAPERGTDPFGAPSVSTVSLKKSPQPRRVPEQSTPPSRPTPAPATTAANPEPQPITISLVKQQARQTATVRIAEISTPPTPTAGPAKQQPTVTLVKTPPRITNPPHTPNYLVPPSPTPNRRNTVALFTLGIVALLVIAGTTTWWFTHRPPPSPETTQLRSDAQLRYTYPEKPTATWTLDPSRVFKRAQFAAPLPAPTGIPRAGLLDLGDTLITTAYLPNSDRQPELVAIDPASGEIRWTAQVGFDAACASRTIGDLLPCFGKLGMGENRAVGVSFFRMSDGSVDHHLPATGISRVEVVGTDIVTAGYDRLARGTVDDLTASWSVPWKSTDACPGSGDEYSFGATDEFVYFGRDAGAMVLRASDGTQVIPTDATSVAIYPGHGLVAVTCPGGSRTTRSTVVLDSTGEHLRTHTGRGGFAAPLAVADTPGSYLHDGAAYDFATGARQWQLGAGVADIVDDTVVLLGEDTISGIDFHTGATRWTHPFDVVDYYTVPFGWLTDRRHLLFTKDDVLQAIDLRTGVTVWGLRGIEDNPQRAGNGFATTDRDLITYYAPTGESATGATTPTGEAESGLVTRCGKAPELTPVRYRTGTEGLIVRMELRAACPGGDIISTDALRVSITQSDQMVATGIFDFSTAPLALPEPGDTAVRHDFTFPFGAFWRLPNSLGSGTDPGAQQIDSVHDQVVACVDIGTSRGLSEGRTNTGTIAASVATGTVAPVDQERFAFDALRAQADADRPWIHRTLAERWLPQLSSKQVGLVAPDTDGRVLTWSATTILEQHLRLRVQYPEVRLLRSDEWRTFDLRGWWVSVAGATFADPEPANQWCDARGIAIEECFAKLVSDTRDSTGTTRYRRR